MRKWSTNYELTCVECGKTFHATNKDAMFCCDKCKKDYTKRRSINRKSAELIANGIENEDYIIDRWNGLACKRIYGGWMKTMHPGKTSEDYKKEFPDALLCCKKDKYNTSKNSGQFMKTDEYRKKYSEMLKGENNPNHKSKTTEQQRKERSPFSKEFYKTRGRDENEVYSFAKKALKDRLTETQLDYWIEKGYNEETAKEMLAKRQRTFTLEKCIAKYGNKKGIEIWNKRQEKWKKSLTNHFIKYGDTRNALAQSEFAILCIKAICNKLQILIPFSEKFITNKNTGKHFAFDFQYENKLIEFNGDYWHCNPSKYSFDYFNKRKNMTAKEIWEYDKEKINTAESYGYKVLVVWESEYNENKENTIQKCIDFINS